MIVEDDRYMRKLLNECFRALGAGPIACVGDGAEALRELAIKPVDL